MTSNIINLNKIRKARERALREANAETNRAKFGRTRQQKSIEESQTRKLDASLDGTLLDSDDTDNA